MQVKEGEQLSSVCHVMERILTLEERRDFQVCIVDAFVCRFTGLRTIEALAKFFSFSLFTSVRFVDGC